MKMSWKNFIDFIFNSSFILVVFMIMVLAAFLLGKMSVEDSEMIDQPCWVVIEDPLNISSQKVLGNWIINPESAKCYSMYPVKIGWEDLEGLT